jgi:hypothetical protein
LRFWLSGPRILKGLVRPGISIGPEDVHPHLPSYRRYELRKGLQEAAKARGEPMTKEDADYCIDKGLATGVIDSHGGLNFVIKGSREEIIEGTLEKAAAWNMPMTRAEAEEKADKAITASRRLRPFWQWLIFLVSVTVAVVWIIAAALASQANARECCQDSSYDSNYRNGGDYQRNGWLHDGAKCFNEWGERGTYFGHHCYRDSDD